MTDNDKALVERLGAQKNNQLNAIEAAARIEAQAAEIERLEKEVERRFYDGIHTCHDECQRVPCRQRREIERLQDALKRIAGGWPKPMQLAREALEQKK